MTGFPRLNGQSGSLALPSAVQSPADPLRGLGTL